jgi:hypothetical protein
MRVVVSPVIVGDRICRIVSPVQSLLEVEEWAGDWWEPSSIPLTTASLSPAADESILRERGVPEADCVTHEPRPAQLDIEASLLTRDPERPAQMRFDEDVRRSTGPRKRKYPGNARFRRGTQSTTDAERRRDASGEWNGPWRRSTDRPPPDEPA